jgi:predicted peptidase
MNLKAFTTLALSLSVFCPMKAKAQTLNTALPVADLKWNIQRHAVTQYLFYLPKDYQAKGRQRWPLLLFLHGAGERGTNVQHVAIHGPLSLVRQGTNFPFIIVAPQCPAGQLWENEPLLKLLDQVTKKYAVDPNRVYLTGLSMGGYGTWSLVVDHPERFAAAAPICGGDSLISVLLAKHYETSRLTKLKQVGVWAFHGAKDTTVPLGESERMVAALREAGCKDVKLTVYPEADHNSWTETYNHPELYEWLLSHGRAGGGVKN